MAKRRPNAPLIPPSGKPPAEKKPKRHEIAVNIETYGKLLQKDGAVGQARIVFETAKAMAEKAINDLNESISTLLSVEGIKAKTFNLTGIEERDGGQVVIVEVT